MNFEHKSIDIYCIDGTKCINKGDADWDYYNISMIDRDGNMAESIFETLDKCRAIRAEYVSSEKYLRYGNSEKDLLRYINRQFDMYNKYYSRFSVDDGKFVFSNKFGTAKISFDDINFKVNKSTKSIEFHCQDGSKCIKKYDFKNELTTWNYYNVSLLEADGNMSDVVYTVKEKCDKLKALYAGESNDDGDDGDESVAALLNYINKQFSKYNSYEATLNVRNNKLIFANNMSDADPMNFNDIGFRMNKGTKSVEIYCLDNSKCIRKGDSDWDYYNVSMLDDGEMASEVYTVLEKCKKLKRAVLNGGAADDVVDEDYDDNSISGILSYVNRQFSRFNSFESNFEVKNNRLVFTNNMSATDPLNFNDIGFRVNEDTKSVEIYCLDNSKCIPKGGSDWDYYNVSMVSSSGNMANEVYKVSELCNKMKKMILKDGGAKDEDNSGRKKKNTGSTDGTGGNTASKKKIADQYLSDINRWYQNNGKEVMTWEIDWANKQLVYTKADCKCYIPLENTTISYQYVSLQKPEPYGIDFKTNDKQYELVCNKGNKETGDELFTYLNNKSIADDTVEAFQRIQKLVLFGKE